MKRKIKAWYWRNFKYKKKMFSIIFDSYKPEIFEILQSGGGLRLIYLGKGKYIQINKDESKSI